jgi:hypothetical protein
LGHFQPFRSRHLASVRNCIQTRMWRRRGMISSWENPHYLKVNHWRSSERLHSLTTPPVTSVQPPRTLGRRSPSTSPIILLLGSGRSSHRRPVSTRLRPTAPARLFRPCSCASIDRDATRRDGRPPSLLAGCLANVCGGGVICSSKDNPFDH